MPQSLQRTFLQRDPILPLLWWAENLAKCLQDALELITTVLCVWDRTYTCKLALPTTWHGFWTPYGFWENTDLCDDFGLHLKQNTVCSWKTPWVMWNWFKKLPSNWNFINHNNLWINMVKMSSLIFSFHSFDKYTAHLGKFYWYFSLLITFLLFCRTPQEQLQNILSNTSPHPSEAAMEVQSSQNENDVDSNGQLSFN